MINKNNVEDTGIKPITNWHRLSDFIESWGNPVLSKFVLAERRTALNPGDASGPVAKYREANLFPGTLQTRNYVEALCRGAGFDQEWTQRNIILRMARQHLLQIAGVRQEFLVDEAALTYWPGRFSEVVAPQLRYALDVLQYDFKGGNRLSFRVVPTAQALALPERGVYADAFALFQRGDDDVEGFTEPWPTNRLEVAAGDTLDLLRASWDQIGAVALSRADSMDLLQQKLRDL